LQAHLQSLKANGQREWHAKFRQIERILGQSLPPSARKFPEWWANENPNTTAKSQCRAWALAGWKTANIDVQNQTLSFFANRQDGKSQDRQNQSFPVETLSLYYRWIAMGSACLDHKGRIQFPKSADRPAIYRLTIKNKDGVQVYIGETDNLRRRLQGYRTPGPTQPTNKRLQAVMVDTLCHQGVVHIDCLDICHPSENTQTDYQLSIESRFVRCLYENAAIIKCLQNGDRLLNL